MKRAIPAIAASCFLAFTGLSPALAGPPEGQICDPMDSGKIEVTDESTTVLIQAPDGMVIDDVCIKAGSVKQGLGAVTTDAYEGQTSAYIVYPAADKAISHYSVSYRECDPVYDLSCDPYGQY